MRTHEAGPSIRSVAEHGYACEVVIWDARPVEPSGMSLLCFVLPLVCMIGVVSRRTHG